MQQHLLRLLRQSKAGISAFNRKRDAPDPAGVTLFFCGEEPRLQVLQAQTRFPVLHEHGKRLFALRFVFIGIVLKCLGVLPL